MRPLPALAGACFGRTCASWLAQSSKPGFCWGISTPWSTPQKSVEEFLSIKVKQLSSEAASGIVTSSTLVLWGPSSPGSARISESAWIVVWAMPSGSPFSRMLPLTTWRDSSPTIDQF
ncbi:hypothetical protein LINPERHAP1_LOCUS550 [Linum perenne]